MKKLIQFCIGLLALGLVATTANAGSLAVPRHALAPQANELIQKTHGLHTRCALGNAGWHRNNYAGIRVACRPPQPPGPWVWQCYGGGCGWWHPVQRHHHHVQFPGLYINIR